MSDTAYPTFQHYGTAAQRAAFTPNPAGGTQPIYEWYETDTDNVYIYTTAWKGPFSAATSSGRLKQVVNTQTGAVATGTTQIPMDDTIPQITEGTEFMTLAITPQATTNKLKIDIVVQLGCNAVVWNTAALFQDATTNALASGSVFSDSSPNAVQVHFTHYMTAGTTSSTTFRVRCGPSASATMTFNGSAGLRLQGGVFASSITISEIVP